MSPYFHVSWENGKASSDLSELVLSFSSMFFFLHILTWRNRRLTSPWCASWASTSCPLTISLWTSTPWSQPLWGCSWSWEWCRSSRLTTRYKTTDTFFVYFLSIRDRISPKNTTADHCPPLFLGSSPPDAVQMAADCPKKLQNGPLPQLETRLQRLPVHVCHVNGKDHANSRSVYESDTFTCSPEGPTSGSSCAVKSECGKKIDAEWVWQNVFYFNNTLTRLCNMCKEKGYNLKYVQMNHKNISIVLRSLVFSASERWNWTKFNINTFTLEATFQVPTWGGFQSGGHFSFFSH